MIDSPALVRGAADRRASRPRGRPGTGSDAVAFSGWTGAALAALEFAGVRGETVLCPSNTFMATPLAALHAGRGSSSSTATARTSACRSPTSRRKVARHRPKAAILVHIGGHIAFEVERIAALCRAEGIFLIEDCAHAHGAGWHGRRPGHVGRRRRVVVLRDEDDLDGRGRDARLARTRSCSTSRARSATTASPTTRCTG